MSKPEKVRNLNQISKGTDAFFNLVFILLSLLCIFPVVFVFSISISSEAGIQKYGYQIIPTELSASAYQFLWTERGTILHALFISVLVTAIGIVISVLLTTSMGYVLSRNTYALKGFYTWVVFIPMIFNGGMLASYVVNANILHLRDTIWALILPLAVSSFNVVICKTFFKTTIPDSIVESAKMDGASQLRIFLRAFFQSDCKFSCRLCYRFPNRFWQPSDCLQPLDTGMIGSRRPCISPNRICSLCSLC